MDSQPLVSLRAIVFASLSHVSADWNVDSDDFWCRVTPVDHRGPEQGWKLHVSATPLSAPIVLRNAADVLLRAGCAFKFARNIDTAEYLVSARYARGGSGKFLTAYPRDDAEFQHVAAELDRVTEGLPGPEILSDRRYHPGSLVFYRYGVFEGRPALSNDGTYESMLVSPDGDHVPDQRNAWFAPPPWATLPLAHTNGVPDRKPATQDEVKPVLLAGRFVVREAIQHANRGGVFRATDQDTGADVVIKQARRHVGAGLDGTDVRDTLRHEAAMLDVLGPSGLAPATVSLFTQQEDVFLAEEFLPGRPLREWAAEHAVGGALDRATALAVCRQLVDLVATAHELDLVLRDFNPNNVMVSPDGVLRLVDLEAAVAAGTRAQRMITPGFAAPELLTEWHVTTVVSSTSDLYALGATMLYAVTGCPPTVGPDDDASRRTIGQRVRALVDLLATGHPVVAWLSPLLHGLLDDVPERRWSLARARAFLENPATPAATCLDDDDDVDRLLRDGLDHVLATMRSDATDRLWPSGTFGSTTDPCNVQHGAAGVLAVLVRAYRAMPEQRLSDAIERAANWIDRRLWTIPRLLPGLYFGRSGTAWALHEAAVLLGDDTMAADATRLALRIPLDWANPDVCHGLAGAGLTQLRFWAATGEAEFGVRARVCADRILAAATPAGDGLLWRIPSDFQSRLAGLRHLGFAHGVAGIGAFLLAAADATGDERYLAAAHGAAVTLVSTARIADGRADWPAEFGDERSEGHAPDWCSGAAGIGTFLIRIGRDTGVAAYRELAELAGAAAYAARAVGSPAACHGLAGRAQLLLDLAADAPDSPYQAWARESVSYIVARAMMLDGRLLAPDETLEQVVVDYQTGLTGVLDLLLRLRYGGDRPWMVDVR